MEQRRLGRSELRVPVLGFGTATFGGEGAFASAWGATTPDEAARLVDAALDAGATFFDSADVYANGHAEELLGRALAGRRARALVATKAGFRAGAGADDVGAGRRHLIAACESSLRRLGTDWIDLYQLHGFDALVPVEETLGALDELTRAGKIRFAGCSNFSGWHLMKSLGASERGAGPRYVAHQAYYNLLAREYEWELMPLAIDQEVATIVYSALAGGQLTGKLVRDRPPPDGSRLAALAPLGPEYPREQLHAIVDELAAIARELGRTVAQVALAWTLARPTVATIVLGARTEPQLRETLAAAELRLDEHHLKRLDDASARSPIYPYWHQRLTMRERNPPPVR
ncbi:MAG TPA: aldo/keto reductase [Polyangia bacterium]|nr:aldo/keto reductase [Polyangia bacterium]